MIASLGVSYERAVDPKDTTNTIGSLHEVGEGTERHLEGSMSLCTNPVQVNSITKPLDDSILFRDAIMPSDEVSECVKHNNFETEIDDANRMAREHGFDMPEACLLYTSPSPRD